MHSPLLGKDLLRHALGAALAAAASAASAGRVLYVAPAGTNDYAGYYGTWSGAASTISAAVSRATDSDTIYVTNATYPLTSNIVVAAAITLRSWNAGALDPEGTILDGQGQARCLYINNAAALVAGFTITNGAGKGNLDSDGGGVRMGGAGGTLASGGVLSNCIVGGNTAPNGGGVFGQGLAAVVTHCRIRGNTATNSGGGAYLHAGFIRDSTLDANTALANQIDGQGGGGLFLRADSRVAADYKMSNAVAERCHIIGNQAVYQGGGVQMIIHAYDGQATNCPRLYGCVISNNVQSTNTGSLPLGGGIYCFLPRAMLISGCTVASNSSWLAGGIGLRGNAELMGIVVTNSVIRGNTALATSGAGGTAGIADLYANAVLTSVTEICNSMIEGNCTTSRFGGVLFTNRGTLIKDCTIRGNSGNRCGGLALGYQENFNVLPARLTIRNCLIAGNTNSENYYSAGLLVYSNVLVESCTVVSNIGLGTYGYGGVHYMRQGASVTNSIVAFNQGAWGANWAAEAGVTPVFAYGCTTPTNGLVGDGNLQADPGVADAPGGNYRLAATSLCRDAGVLQDWMNGAADLDQRPRVDRMTGRVDMGCYEFQPPGCLLLFR